MLLALSLLISLESLLLAFSLFISFTFLKKGASIILKMITAVLLVLSSQSLVFIPFEVLDSSQAIPFSFWETHVFVFSISLFVLLGLGPLIGSFVGKDRDVTFCWMLLFAALKVIVF